MMTTGGGGSEWTAAPLRPTATWVSVRGVDGRARLEMLWAVPTLDDVDVRATATTTSTV